MPVSYLIRCIMLEMVESEFMRRLHIDEALHRVLMIFTIIGIVFEVREVGSVKFANTDKNCILKMPFNASTFKSFLELPPLSRVLQNVKVQALFKSRKVS